MSHTDFGDTLVELADEAISVGEGSSTPGLLENLLGTVTGADDPRIATGLTPGTLFRAFARARERNGAGLERLFRVVARPGDAVPMLLRRGDILVRYTPAEPGLGHVSFLATPVVEPLERARASGWHVESPRPGGYVLVVEGSRAPHVARDRFARRVADSNGRLPVDSLLLRLGGPSAFELAESPGSAPPLRLPAGKGLWTGNLAGAGTPQRVVERMRETDLSWLAVYVLEPSGRRRNPRETLQRYFDALRAGLPDRTLGFWLWGWARPGREEDFVNTMVPAAAEVGAQGVIHDVEAAWKWRRGNAAQEATKRREATALLDRLLPAAHEAGLSVGMTSYGAPWFHRNFPWAEFTRCDFSLPQIYDADNNLHIPTFAPRCDSEWRAMGYPKLMPISNAYSKNADQMRLLLQHTPVSEGAISWWWWHSATRVRREVIRAYAVPAPTATAASVGAAAAVTAGAAP